MSYEQHEASERKRLIGRIRLGGFVLLGILAIATLFGSFYSVAQTERAVHTRFGAIVNIEDPGLRFKLPFIEGARRINVATQTTRWVQEGNRDSRMNTYSRDQQPASIAVTVTWHIPADHASVRRVATEYGSLDNLYAAVVVPSATEGLKNIFGTYDAVSAIQRRAELNAQVLTSIREQIGNRPVVIDTVQIQDIEFSEAYENAVEARMTAQVEVERAAQERETARIRGEQTVITATAEAERTRLAGQAQADAIRARAAALAASPQLVQLTLAERWNGVLPTTMVPGQGVPMIDLRQRPAQ